MKTISNTLLVASLCMLVAVPVHAGRIHNDDRLMNRIERQHDRIQHGIRSGSLDRREVRKLRKNKRKINRLVSQFYEDDVLTGKERTILRNHLDHRSKRIWKLKHNDRGRNTGRVAVHGDDLINRYGNSNKRHDGHDVHCEHRDDAVYRSSESKDWPRYGFLYW